jgi:hypothetical protein
MGINKFSECEEPKRLGFNVNRGYIFNRRDLRNCAFKLYVDANLMLHCGVIRENCHNDVYDEAKIAKTAMQRCESFINNIRSAGLQLEEIRFYFDGIRPRAKKRRVDHRHKFNTCIAIDEFCLLLQQTDYKILRLKIGEGEHEMFRNRDVNYPSIFLTDDTDFHHISYLYAPQTENDECFMLSRQMTMFDLQPFTTIDNNNNNNCTLTIPPEFQNDFVDEQRQIIPRLTYKVLLFCLGTDYTVNFLTPTMVSCMLDLLRQPKSIQRQICDRYAHNNYLYETLQKLLLNTKTEVENETFTQVTCKPAVSFDDPLNNTLDVPYQEIITDTHHGIYTMDEINETLSQIMVCLLILKCDDAKWKVIARKRKRSDESSTSSVEEKQSSLLPSYKFSWPRPKSALDAKYSAATEVSTYVDRYLESLTFTANYSLLGAYYDQYTVAGCYSTYDLLGVGNRTYPLIYELLRRKFNLFVPLLWPSTIAELTTIFQEEVCPLLPN